MTDMESEEESIREKQRLRLRRFGVALVTYAFLFLALIFVDRFGLGKMSAYNWAFFISLVILGNTVFFFLFYNNINLRFQDPSLTREQITYSALAGIVPLYCLPDARPIILMFFIIPLNFGILRLNQRQYISVGASVLAFYALMLVTEYFTGRPGFRIEYELFLFLMYSIIVVWLAFFGGFVSDIRRRLKSYNHEITEANADLKIQIDERKRTEEMLRIESERFRILINNAPFGLMLVDEEGFFKYVNPKFTEIFGYALEDVPDARTWFRKAYPDQEYRKQVIKDWFGDHKAHKNGEKPAKPFEVKCKDGTKKFINFIQVAVNTGAHLVACEDITERLLIEEQLQQAQKMEAVGILAGGIAHDFNNLLQSISGYTQLLLMDKNAQDKDYSKLQAIDKSIERASKLVRQLLFFSRKVEVRIQNLDLNQELAASVKLLKRAVPRMIEIRFQPASSLWTVKADPVQIEQVMLNLGINAADAMPDGGSFVIRTENITIDDSSAINLGVSSAGKYVLVSVSDTGCGIDKETVKHIFEPFFTTKGIGKGTGLGLSSVYGIVKSHGGTIECDSEPGKGTTFSIYLPAIENDDIVPAMPIEKLPEGGTETVLITDDVPDIRFLASQMLMRFGYSVITASSGEEALQIHNQKKGSIDLTILDLGMPGMGGYKCMKEILALNPSAKILIASGYSADGMVIKAIESGEAGFIGKPYQLKELLMRVRSILDEKKRLNVTES